MLHSHTHACIYRNAIGWCFNCLYVYTLYRMPLRTTLYNWEWCYRSLNVYWHLNTWRHIQWQLNYTRWASPCFNITIHSVVGILNLTLRWSRNDIIIIMGIFILVTRKLDIANRLLDTRIYLHLNRRLLHINLATTTINKNRVLEAGLPGNESACNELGFVCTLCHASLLQN